jgi:hypothetical protein
MHENYRDFLIDLNTNEDTEVAFARTLDIGIVDGVQASPEQDNPGDVANRLFVFTGTTIFTLNGPSDDFSRGIVRVRLNFPLTPSLKYVGSASCAALASIHGGDEEDAVFASDGVEARVGPDGGIQLPPNGLPSNELYLLIDTAIFGEESVLSRISYQANVLVLDTAPDVDRVLVRETGLGDFVQHALVSLGKQWDIEVVLTAPNPGPDPLEYFVSTSDPTNVPINTLDSRQQVPPPAQQAGRTMIDPVGPQLGVTATITVQGRRNVRTATIHIITLA